MSPSKLALPFAVVCLAGLAGPGFAASPYAPTVIPGVGPDPGAGAIGGMAAAQRPASTGRYGGGFIEFLMTGSSGPAAGQAPRGTGAYLANTAAGEPGTGIEPAYGAPEAGSPLAQRPVPGYAMPRKAVDPIYLRQEVEYDGKQSPGTIVIDTADKFLFLVEGGDRALRYGIGVGKPGFLWSGEKTISRKAEWPDWTPPAEMLQRRPDLPLHMEGGIANPLGARAMYLGSSLYRIHGTNEPDTIGTNVSSGCIRLTNDDVSDLYNRVTVGTRVIVM